MRSSNRLVLVLICACASALAIPLARAGVTTRVSVSSDGMQGNNTSYDPSISANGRYVAFSSDADSLVAGDTNGYRDVFVHDCQTGVTRRVSVSSTGTQAHYLSRYPSISADGRYVAFVSGADNLVVGDTNGEADVFVHDRQTGVTERVSVSSSGAQGNDWSGDPSISADGRHVAFQSAATNLVPGDTNNRYDVFVHDRETDTTERVSVSTSGLQANLDIYDPSISGDGRHVAFYSRASSLVPGDTNDRYDVFVHDRQIGVTERVSVSSSGTQGKYDSQHTSISVDGRYVAFSSDAPNLVPGDTIDTYDIFVRDRQIGVTEKVSVCSDGTQGIGGSVSPSITADGRYVAFESGDSNLVPGDTNYTTDILIHDRQTGVTERLSVSSSATQGNHYSFCPSISADGRRVALQSYASNLVASDMNGYADVFVRDRFGSGVPPSAGSSPGFTPPTSASYSVIDPYSGYAVAKRIKGELHCHYFQDILAAFGWMPKGLKMTGGVTSVFPEVLLGQYKAMGYDFVCITEHNHCTTRPVLEPTRFVYQCEEAGNSPNHVLAIGTHPAGIEVAPQDYERISYPWDKINNGYREVLDASDNRLRSIVGTIHSTAYGSGVAILAHPNVGGYHASASDVTGGEHDTIPDAVSIYTAASLYDATDFWDAVLAKNKLRDVGGIKLPVFGAVEDDYTPWYLHALGRTWIVVEMDSSDDSSDGIVSAIRNGRYWMYRCAIPYIGKGPQLQLAVSGLPGKPVISVISDTTLSRISFVGGKQDVGVTSVAAFPNTSSAQFQCTGGESYVRVVGYQASSGMLIYSQPIVITPGGGSGGGGWSLSKQATGSGQSAATGSVPADIIYSYAQPADLPGTPPPHGYIGHAFHVSTSSGAYPSGSVLSISYQGIDVTPYGAANLAAYKWDGDSASWEKLASTADIGSALVTTPLTQAGLYAVGADIPSDATDPTISIHAPSAGATVSGSQVIGVQAYDNVGVQSVSFFLDGISIGGDSFGPDGYTCQYDFSRKAAGGYKLKAVAYDVSGNAGEAEVTVNVASSGSAPTVAISSPTAGAVLQGLAPVSGTCGDDSMVAGVFIAVDSTWVGEATLSGGTWSYELDTSIAPNGPHVLSAIVLDEDYNASQNSVNVTVDGPTVAKLADVFHLADGQQARISGRVVTFGNPGDSGAFYVEEAGRSSGIRILGNLIPWQGDLVSASGTMSTSGGERVLAGANVLQLSASNPVPEPLGMVVRSLGGSPLGLYTPGIAGGAGLSNIGLLIRTWGKVTQVGDGYLYIDDGSGLRDGTSTGAEVNVGVRVICDPAGYSVGDKIEVTGISSCFWTPSGIGRRILTRRPNDVRKLNGP